MKAKSKPRPKRSIFLEAAYRQFLRGDDLTSSGNRYTCLPGDVSYKKYSCENIASVKNEMTGEMVNYWDKTDVDLNFYRKMFYPDAETYSAVVDIWWDAKDNESRIYALLLAAEMLRR